MRRKSNKTVNLTKINIAHREACAKHPKFCDHLTTYTLAGCKAAERLYKEHNSSAPYYAEELLHEELFEAFVAYKEGDKKHCLQELAQCGAVILRMMQFVQDEMELGR